MPRRNVARVVAPALPALAAALSWPAPACADMQGGPVFVDASTHDGVVMLGIAVMFVAAVSGISFRLLRKMARGRSADASEDGVAGGGTEASDTREERR